MIVLKNKNFSKKKDTVKKVAGTAAVVVGTGLAAKHGLLGKGVKRSLGKMEQELGSKMSKSKNKAIRGLGNKLEDRGLNSYIDSYI